MNEENELKKALFYALKVSNLRPRSVKELKNKLKEKGFSDSIIDGVVSEFSKKGLLNDTKFSKVWLEGRMASNPKGEIVLREELEKKGIEKNIIDEAIAKYRKEYDEYEIVKNLADARIASLKGLDKIVAKRRLFGYLRRRGFSFEVIMKVIEETLRDY